MPLTGRWTIVDTVTTGDDSGATYMFTVNIVEDGSTITGSGSQLQFVGTRSGNTLHVEYTRAGGTGSFSWTVDQDGTLNGSFADYAASNSGTSRATRS